MKIANEKVYHYGTAPQEFLDELVQVTRQLPGRIFSLNYKTLKEPDVFEFLSDSIPWVPHPSKLTDPERRALMCELLRVLGGFESSWNWKQGRDTTNPESFTPCTTEAGLWQCSGDSLYGFDKSLMECFVAHYKVQSRHYKVQSRHSPSESRDRRCGEFQALTKSYPPFAIEYVCRLLRFTVRHHGPLKRGEVFPWLRESGYKEFLTEMGVPSTPVVVPPEPDPEDQTDVFFQPIKIVVDPGHGDHDSGAVGYLGETAYYEKDVNLAASNQLVKLLSEDPRFEVKPTRQKDLFLSLGRRAEIANEFNADLLLSLHANAGGGTGHEVYTSRGQTRSDEIATALFNSYSKEFPVFEGRTSLEDGDPDKEAGFAVLTKTKGPAVLYELGFMDTPEDLFEMIQSNFAFRVARALYQGLLDAWGLPPLSDSDVPEVPEVPVIIPPAEPSREWKEAVAEWLMQKAREKEAMLPALLDQRPYSPGDFYTKCREASACRDAARTLRSEV